MNSPPSEFLAWQAGTPEMIAENGASADQPTFHRWYRAAPEDFRAELVLNQNPTSTVDSE